MGHFWLCRDLGCPSFCHELHVLLSLWCLLLQPLVSTPTVAAWHVQGICCDRPCILHQHTFICCAGYAHPILDVLDPTGRLFAARLYRDATTATLHHSNVKVELACHCAFAAVSTHTAAHLGLAIH